MCSKEIVGSSARNVGLASSRCGVEHQEIVVHVFVHLHNTRLVTATVTVVGCRKDRHHLLFVTPVVSRHDQLVRSCHGLQSVFLIKLLGDVLTKRIASTTWRNTPARAVVRIRPKQIAHRPFVGHFDHAVDVANLVERVKTGRKAAVQTEDLVLNDRS